MTEHTLRKRVKGLAQGTNRSILAAEGLRQISKDPTLVTINVMMMMIKILYPMRNRTGG